jgi:hypothetical protein
MAKAGQGGSGSRQGCPAKNKGPPPVERWNPALCGDIDMRIAADGTWFYQKTPIGRLALVKLFRLGAQTGRRQVFLVTPVERWGSSSTMRHFAVEMNASVGDAGRALQFRTNVDD